MKTSWKIALGQGDTKDCAGRSQSSNWLTTAQNATYIGMNFELEVVDSGDVAVISGCPVKEDRLPVDVLIGASRAMVLDYIYELSRAEYFVMCKDKDAQVRRCGLVLKGAARSSRSHVVQTLQAFKTLCLALVVGARSRGQPGVSEQVRAILYSENV